MATYSTQISYDGAWHDDTDLTIQIKNRKGVVPASGTPPTGTTVTWSGPNGDATITFFNDDWSFKGNAQFPGEGPVGYRGKLKS